MHDRRCGASLCVRVVHCEVVPLHHNMQNHMCLTDCAFRGLLKDGDGRLEGDSVCVCMSVFV